MKKQITIILLILAAMILTSSCKKEEAPKESGQAVEEQAKPLIISAVSATSRQKAVAFNHTAHKQRAASMGKNCKTCHHKGNINEKCSTRGCHFGPGAEQLVHKKCYGECHLSAPGAPKQAQCAACHKP